jgi:hypothetical protein
MRALDKGNICSNSKSEYLFFFLAFLSSQTRAFVRLLAEELGRWRCIGSGRRGGESVEVVSFFKSMRVRMYTSLVTAAALVIEKKRIRKKES